MSVVLFWSRDWLMVIRHSSFVIRRSTTTSPGFSSLFCLPGSSVFLRTRRVRYCQLLAFLPFRFLPLFPSCFQPIRP
jgi:hypothetical protein